MSGKKPMRPSTIRSEDKELSKVMALHNPEKWQRND